MSRESWTGIGVAAGATLVLTLAGCGKDGGPASAPGEPRSTVEQAPAPDAAAQDPAAAQRLEMVRSALDRGVDVNEADPDGRTPLMMAAFEGQTEVVRLLLDRGATLSQRDALGRTALMYASTGPFEETVELLLERGSEIDRVEDEEGWSALMFAAGEGLDPIVALLLRHGADPAIEDGDGDTAADHARMRGHDELARTLDAASGRR